MNNDGFCTKKWCDFWCTDISCDRSWSSRCIICTGPRMTGDWFLLLFERFLRATFVLSCHPPNCGPTAAAAFIKMMNFVFKTGPRMTAPGWRPGQILSEGSFRSARPQKVETAAVTLLSETCSMRCSGIWCRVSSSQRLWNISTCSSKMTTTGYTRIHRNGSSAQRGISSPWRRTQVIKWWILLFEMMNFVFKTMNFVFKTMNFVFKTTNSCGWREISREQGTGLQHKCQDLFWVFCCNCRGNGELPLKMIIFMLKNDRLSL